MWRMSAWFQDRELKKSKPWPPLIISDYENFQLNWPIRTKQCGETREPLVLLQGGQRSGSVEDWVGGGLNSCAILCTSASDWYSWWISCCCFTAWDVKCLTQPDNKGLSVELHDILISLHQLPERTKHQQSSLWSNWQREVCETCLVHISPSQSEEKKPSCGKWYSGFWLDMQTQDPEHVVLRRSWPAVVPHLMGHQISWLQLHCITLNLMNTMVYIGLIRQSSFICRVPVFSSYSLRCGPF